MAGRILIALILVGCGGGDDAPSGSTGDMGTGTGMTMSMSSASASATAPATSDASMSDDSASSSGTPQTSGESSSDGSGPPPGSSSSSTAGDEGGNCDPDAQKSECFMCVTEHCCQVWTACMADEGCACVIDCHVTQGNSLGSCESSCNSDGELYQAVFFCGQQSCLGTCDWDCC